jgi:hypothetical protein
MKTTQSVFGGQPISINIFPRKKIEYYTYYLTMGGILCFFIGGRSLIVLRNSLKSLSYLITCEIFKIMFGFI